MTKLRLKTGDARWDYCFSSRSKDLRGFRKNLKKETGNHNSKYKRKTKLFKLEINRPLFRYKK